jgi:NTE family protein
MAEGNAPARTPPGAPHQHDYDMVALVLQGGGALGAYQAGVFEGLSEAGIQPQWLSGVSIGAINAAIIAGNKAENQVARLRDFWEMVTSHGYARQFESSEPLRPLHNLASAWLTMMRGIPGFFSPRTTNPWLAQPGGPKATSFYDTNPLVSHLDGLIDWDLLNSNRHRLSVGTVNIESGNFRYFDSSLERLDPRHVMASGALPPAFPAVEIDGCHYWDGGIVSNTPLQYLLDQHRIRDTLVFQVDLFNARGPVPKTMGEVNTRSKDIMFSSRTRNTTDKYRRIHALEARLRDALARLAPEQLSEADRALMKEMEDVPQVNILHLVYHQKAHEGGNKDYEFSRLTMRDHWAAGLEDTRRTLAHTDWFRKPSNRMGITVHDVHREGTGRA